MFRKMILAALVVASVGLVAPPKADAQQIPTRDSMSISNATAKAFQIPALQNGTVDVVSIWGCNPTNATLTVKHVYSTGGITVTGTLGTVTGALGTGNGSATISNAYVIPGDWLLYQFSAAATGTVSTVRRVPN